MIERTSGGAVTTGFPLYDAHGNMVATLSRSGSGYAVADRRSYDAWGAVRSQQGGGDPKMRYCANLGHRQDDESGMVYMRARYYEPTSGRFVSEEPYGEGGNWFAYCGNDPVGGADPTGNYLIKGKELSAFSFFYTLGTGLAIGACLAKDPTERTGLILLATWSYFVALGGTNVSTSLWEKAILASPSAVRILVTLSASLKIDDGLKNNLANAAIFAAAAESMMLFAALLSIDGVDDDDGSGENLAH